MNTTVFEKCKLVQDLNNIIISTNERLEGNCLYLHLGIGRIRYENGETEKLRQNLYKLAKNASNILEIGFNGGHSCALFIYANPNIKILAFDLCEHKYTEHCANYLKKNIKLEFIKGNSLITVQNYNNKETFDVIHIDGGHGDLCAINDLKNCKNFANSNTILVFDDTHFGNIAKIIEEFITNNYIKEINYESKNLEKTCNHRIFNYCFE